MRHSQIHTPPDFRHRPASARVLAAALASLLLPAAAPASGTGTSPGNTVFQEHAAEPPPFTHALIAPIHVPSDEHITLTKNNVRFDVFFNRGPKHNAAIYAINTGRKQLSLPPEKHQAILEDLVRRKFTVIVADFKDKQLRGRELEHYIVQLTEDAREAADGVLTQSGHLRPPLALRVPATSSRTETFANDYFTLMPGFTVQRDVTWFRYSDIPEPFRREIARQLDKPFRPEDGAVTNSYDIIHPVYGPDVGVLTNYASAENGRQDYYPLPTMSLVMAFAFKNLAIVHQQYFNDPAGGYHKGYDYYGDQFAVCFIRHLKGNASRYHLDPAKICGFGHSKGSEIPGMLLNKLRGVSPFFHAKADFKRVALRTEDKLLPSPYAHLPADIACAILGAGIANSEMANPKMMPWDREPSTNISPFFLYADHRASTRLATDTVVARARANGLAVETAALEGHTWPFGPDFDRASEFADKFLRPVY